VFRGWTRGRGEKRPRRNEAEDRVRWRTGSAGYVCLSAGGLAGRLTSCLLAAQMLCLRAFE